MLLIQAVSRSLQCAVHKNKLVHLNHSNFILIQLGLRFMVIGSSMIGISDGIALSTDVENLLLRSVK
jgi:hypothetical protein